MKKIFSISIFLSLFFQGCMVWPLVVGAVGLSAGNKGGNNNPFLLLLGIASDPVITRIELSAQDSSIAKGTSTALQVTAIFDDGTNMDITDSTSIVSDSQAIVEVQGNRSRGISLGSSTLQAEYKGLYSQFQITVTPAILDSIQVTSLDRDSLPKGLNRQFSAIGIFSDGSHQDLSNDPLTIWSSSDSSLVRVNDSGLASGRNLGTAHIHASFGSKRGSATMTVGSATLSSIEIAPINSNLPLGKKQQLVATGIYSDNSNKDISSLVTWDILDNTIATIQPKGVVETVSTGSTTVLASIGSSVGSTTLNVVPASLVSISVSSVNSSKAKGLKENFIATGIFSDNSSLDITNQVTWSSSDRNILTVSNASGSHGLGSALNQGAVKVIASVGGIEGSADFTVTQASLVSISVSPILPSMPKGLTQQFKATGIFTDNSKQDLTSSVTWTSSSKALSVSNVSGREGMGQAVAVGSATITAKLGTTSGKTTIKVAPAVLASIQISPMNTTTLAKGLRKNFFARGIYSDNSSSDITSSVTWFSSDPSVAAVDNVPLYKGEVRGEKIGTTNIKAALGKVSSPTVELSVTAAELVSIEISPYLSVTAKGLTKNFKATGTFTDYSTQDITEQVTWKSSDTEIISIENAVGSKGLAHMLKQGDSDITATLGSISSSPKLAMVTSPTIVSVAVTPSNPSVAKGLTYQFKATATYTDNSTGDITSAVSWSSSDSNKALVSNDILSGGLVTAIASGSANITARYENLSGSSTLNVTPATLTSIEVTPIPSSVAKGLTEQFTATGIYSDKSTQDLTQVVTWTSSDSSRVAIENTAGKKGLALASTLGSSNIKATYNSIQSSPVSMTVTEAKLASITVSPESTSKALGLTQQFKAKGTFTDGSERDITDLVTWSSSKPLVAYTINAGENRGLAVAHSVGATEIHAYYDSVESNSVNFKVTSSELVSIEISPENGDLMKGFHQQYTAFGVYSDGNLQDISNSVTWSSSNTSSVSISNAVGSKGKATALQVGTSKITATYRSLSRTTDVNVSAPTLSSIVVSPTKPNVESTSKTKFFAVGMYSDGTKRDLTSSVTWFSSSTNHASVSNASKSKGLVVAGSGTGYSTITATYGSISGNTLLIVNKYNKAVPTVKSVASLSPTTIRVVYSEFVNNKEALKLSNYKVVDSSALVGTCSNNADFKRNSQTRDFSLKSISGAGDTFTIALSGSQNSNKAYTLLVNRPGIHDRSYAPKSLGCPNNADFMGKEQLKLTNAVCNSVNRVIVSFSKPLYTGKDIAKSAECSNPSECKSRYKFAGVSSLGDVTSAKVLNGKVCGGAPADPSKVCLTHTLLQSGGHYTVIAANRLDGDGFDNDVWGAISDSSGQENLQSSPKDRANFVGCGGSPVNFADGPVISDPFGDGSSFGSLTNYNYQVYLGPNRKGNQAVRFRYDGTSPESVFFSFAKDAVGEQSSNTALSGISANYVTMGHAGCTRNSADIVAGCGPDNEDGRGVFATGSLGGRPHMFVAGSKSLGGLDYLYYSSNADAGLDFKYIDMGTITGALTAGASSIAVFDNRVYVGFAKKNNRSNAPDFGRITFHTSDSTRCVIGSNCDATDGQRGSRFRIDRMPYFGGESLDDEYKGRVGSTARFIRTLAAGNNGNKLDQLGGSTANWGYYVGIDSLFVFKEKLYAANGGFPNSLHNGSIIRSKSANPAACEGKNRCSGWEDAAPRSNSKWHNSPNNNWFSLELVRDRDLIPADKAFSQFAEFNGRMYVTRTICVTSEDRSGLRKSLQTVKGCTDGSYTNRRPQLWKCDPTLSGNKSTCDSGDWSVVGDNGTGFTNFGNVSNHSMTMVVANGSYLYVGFDNENGIQIWRTNLQNPGSSSDGWEQVGGDGLGDVTNRQIYSGITVPKLSLNYVYVSAGGGNRPVKVYRQQNK
ncbi:Ig-like domain-containing protein [Leptospira weilii]|uniref:Ig-like domain-containing protein n=1 Tax=Leptospira weilii TaxID=28184 RepID=UPI000774E399|nr:Ig-like domain-containing protein [Leptospira weilii]